MNCHARLSIFLSLLILIFFLTLPVKASYSDVPPEHWASDAINTLSSGGLLSGYGGGLFGPNDTLSVAQLATVITRACGGTEYVENGYWAAGALRYCRDSLDCLPDFGEIAAGVYDGLCSRELSAHMIINGLGSVHEFSQTDNSVPDIPDLADATPAYRYAIILSYQNNVIVGVDAAGSFSPRSGLTRAQLAMILYRIGVTSAPSSDNAPVSFSDEQMLVMYRNLIRPTMNGFVESPTTEAEFVNNIIYMSNVGEYKMVLRYPYDTSRDVLDLYFKLAANAAEYYPELGYRCKRAYTLRTYTFRKEASKEDLRFVIYFCDSVDLVAPTDKYGESFPVSDQKRAAAMRAAVAIRQALYDTGELHDGMSELERAKVLYLAILERCSYDESSVTPDDAHLPYAALCSGTAVCDGFAGAYNLLLRLEGIDCHGVLGTNHLWSEAVLDGVSHHIDPTWGDVWPDPLFFFAMSPEFSLEIHEKYGSSIGR